MDKAGLLELIARINTREENVRVSTETTRWKALREAETLTDPALFPLLREIIEENEGKYLLHSMLDRVKDWQGRQGILLPPELDTSPVARLAEDDRWLVRHAAIHALGTCPGEESRAVLRRWLSREDEKACKYELWYAAIAMQSVGEPEDIPLLERFLKSRRRDLKITAKNAIQYIKEREEKARREVKP